jgi:4-hydroxy-tetrahydrodipicolinate synthase
MSRRPLFHPPTLPPFHASTLPFLPRFPLPLPRRSVQLTDPVFGSFMQSVKRFGLSCALALPVNQDFSINYARLGNHAQRLLQTGCTSVTVFGTTGAGASVHLREREHILDTLSAHGADFRRQVVGGVAAASIEGAAEQARLILDRDCRAVLLTPPFYFKNVTDEGLYRWFSQVFEKLRQPRDIILYHIPSVTQVPLSIALIGRLKAAFPEIIFGVKDSGGDWSYTESLLRAHGDLILLIGDERHLAAGIQLGAQGAISGLANVCPEILRGLIASGEENPRIVELVDEVLKFPVIPAVQALIAHTQNDPPWLNVRPPLTPLAEPDIASLIDAYRRLIC